MRYCLIYKIINVKNGMFYVGAHSTNDIYDNYMGSGILIKKAIKFHGIDNFEKEILKYCQNVGDMYKHERLIVNKKFISNPQCYNLVTGGKRKSKNTCKVKARSKNCKEILLKKRRKRKTK